MTDRNKARGVPFPLQGALLGAGCALLMSALSGLGALDALERAVSDALFRARGERLGSGHIVVLLVDDETVKQVGRLPVPRRVYAQAVRRLTGAGARTIAFNTSFETPSDPADDRDFEAACRASGRVVQAVTFGLPSVFGSSSIAPRFGVTERRSPSALQAGHDPRDDQIAAPLPALMKSAPFLGHLNVTPEAGGGFRHLPHLMRGRTRGNGLTLPSLALAMAAHYRGLKPRDIVARDGALWLGAQRVPLETVRGAREPGARLNWAGGGHAFFVYPLHRLLSGTVPKGLLKDSAVLIGGSRTGSYAPLDSPFSSLLTPTQLQANALDDILSRRPLQTLPALPWTLACFGLAMLTGLVAAVRGARGGALWTLGVCGALWLGAVALMRADIYAPLMVPIGGVMLSGALGIGLRQTREARELKRVRELFDGYVGEEVLRFLGDQMPRLDGETRPVTVLFCDIKGFSGIAETLREDPVRLLGLLNAHFAPLVTSLKQHGAYVDNYLGDMVIAIFGAPYSSGSPADDARQAVRAALDFVRLVEAGNVARRAGGETPIEIGIGVHCGQAVVGNLGAQKKMHYTALGDTVNVGARIEGLTRAFNTPLLVSEDVVRACENASENACAVRWEFVAEAAVKGRSAPVRLYRCASLDG